MRRHNLPTFRCRRPNANGEAVPALSAARPFGSAIAAGAAHCVAQGVHGWGWRVEESWRFHV